MRIVIPGGSGQIGRLLGSRFHETGHSVTVLSRRPLQLPWKVVPWNGQSAGAWISTLEGSDICINLTGRSVNCRYTKENRRAILESRVQSTRLLNEVIGSLKQPPRLWLNASTAAIYRQAYDQGLKEDGPIGGEERDVPNSWNFPVEVAKAWEQAFFSTSIPQTRKVAMRTSLVMSPDRGSVFDVLLGFVRRGLGGAQGSGDQYVSWIHERDFVSAIDLLVEREEFSGIVNLAAPNPLPNRDFMRVLREAWGAPFGLPAKRWMIEIGSFFMRTEAELVLKSRRVLPGRLIDAGFEFQFPDWPAAAKDLVARWKRTS